MWDSFKNRNAYNYEDNKDIIIKKIDKLHVNNFRSLRDRDIILGDNITIIVGRNGSMKTTLMGLLAQSLRSDAKDAFKKTLKTLLGKIFRISLKYDDNYDYELFLTTNKNEKIKETVTIDVRGGRHRIVVSGHEKGDGNFNYNTSFLNMNRISPIIETNAKEREETDYQLSDEEKKEYIKFCETVFPSMSYSEFIPIYDGKDKKTYAPSGEKAYYDFNSISSGEDNLGAIFNKLLGFMRNSIKKKKGGGVFCIDELECSLHPAAQVKIFEYLINWAQEYKVQVIFTTHSLHIIQNIYWNKKTLLENNKIVINFISCSKAGKDNNYEIIQNPEYSLAYRELTLETPELVTTNYKVDVYCEDEMAKHIINAIIKKQSIKNIINIQTNLNNDKINNGNAKSTLTKLCKDYPLIMQKQNSFVVLDADVELSEVQKIKDKNLFMMLPDPEKLAIERRIICYIMSLESDDKFFNIYNKDKTQFLSEFNKAGISPLSIENVKITQIKKCKNWSDSNKRDFKKYITYYCNNSLDKDIVEQFKKDFIIRINNANKRLGLPNVKY